jgi:predicted acyl esterase
MLRRFSLAPSLALLWAPSLVCAQALPSTVQVAMPDGITLSTDVWKPLLSQEKQPVLLRRTPYGRAVDFQVAQALVGAGFVLVSQDVRGRGNSQGTFEPFFDDQVDGRATMEWIATQPWSNGRIATYSNSAEGIVQFMAMGDAPESLRCAHLGMPTHDVYEGLFPGGAWRSELGTKWLTDLGVPDLVKVWKSHEVHDAFRNDATLTTEEMAKVDHPVFILGGMFDIFAPSEVRALRELQTYADPKVRGDIFLILGPWTHGGIGERVQGDLLYPEDALYSAWVDELLTYVRWCTQDGPRPSFAPVRYYQTEVSDEVAEDPKTKSPRIVARGSWLESNTWPPPEAVAKKLFLQSTGSLGSTPTQDKRIELAVNPAAPLPSVGGGNLSTAAGPFDQAALDAMPGVFVAASEPVSEPTELRGNLELQLWASSATTDIDVIVRAEVLTASGKAVAFADGVRRGRFVRGYAERIPLVPGEPVRFDITLGPLAVKLSPGQALRLAISGTSSPRYEPNPNVGDPLVEATPIPSVLTLYTDDAHPSKLVLPIASGSLPGAVNVGDEEPSDAGAQMDAAAANPDGGVGEESDGDAGKNVTAPEAPKASSCRAVASPGSGSGLASIVAACAVVWRVRRKRRQRAAKESSEAPAVS